MLAHGRAKLARKGCDLLVVNEVGEHRTFGSEENAAVILDRDGGETAVPHGPKEALADVVWDLVAAAGEPGTSPADRWTVSATQLRDPLAPDRVRRIVVLFEAASEPQDPATDPAAETPCRLRTRPINWP